MPATNGARRTPERVRIAVQPAADASGGVRTERALDLGAIPVLATADDAPPCDARIPAPVALAFRRALRRVNAQWDFQPVCDVAIANAAQTLALISECIWDAYLDRRWRPIHGEPFAAEILERLRRTFVEEIDTQHELLKPGQLTKALRAFDLVRDELDADETQRLVAALRSGNALDLVVEIAHDMRSPLTAILMLTDMVRRSYAERNGDVHRRQLSLVYSAAFGLNSLVNDIVALTRRGDRLIDRVPIPFSASALMHSVADMVRPIAEERKLALRVTTLARPERLGQPLALSRVLLNLASNALKFTEAGEVAIAAVDLDPMRVRFEVVDTGPGIPAEAMQILRDPAGDQPSDARKRRFSTTGLGLAICRRLLGDMGSELRVESSASTGTRFFFELTLPVAADDELPLASGAFIL
jgi:signal transduction histidine kinase